MKKRFSQLNYYEMLDLEPDATAAEIRQAYRDALRMYQPGSLASYSFFSEEERKEILALVEKAYTTLINDQARKAYDEQRGGCGERIVQAGVTSAEKKPVGIFNISRAAAPVPSGALERDRIKDRIRLNPAVADLLAGPNLCGADLKKIRLELGVSLEFIAQETKIRLDHLRHIEEDQIERLPAPVFLKGFVTSYLKTLALEPIGELSARYMTTIARLSSG